MCPKACAGYYGAAAVGDTSTTHWLRAGLPSELREAPARAFGTRL
jgi:hypothetical protein